MLLAVFSNRIISFRTSYQHDGGPGILLKQVGEEVAVLLRHSGVQYDVNGTTAGRRRHVGLGLLIGPKVSGEMERCKERDYSIRTCRDDEEKSTERSW